jgi:hypothetical protein
MSRKNQLQSFAILSAASLATSLTSAVTNIGHLDNIGIQADLTSVDAVGTLAVQVSANYDQDYLGNVLNPGTWNTITSQAIVAGAPASTYFDLNQLSAPWIRLIYTRTSGTGTITAVIVAKML